MFKKGIQKIYGGAEATGFDYFKGLEHQKFRDNMVELMAIRDFYKDPKTNKIKIKNKNIANKVGSLLMFYMKGCPACELSMKDLVNIIPITRNDIGFGMIDVEKVLSGNDVLSEFFSIYKYPTYVFWDGNEYSLYEGKRDFLNLLNYICMKTGKCYQKSIKKINEISQGDFYYPGTKKNK